MISLRRLVRRRDILCCNDAIYERTRELTDQPLYHTGDQYAVALLPPIVRSLGVLAERADHYATRLRMPDGDRELIEMAYRILQIAQQDLANLLADVGKTGATS